MIRNDELTGNAGSILPVARLQIARFQAAAVGRSPGDRVSGEGRSCRFDDFAETVARHPRSIQAWRKVGCGHCFIPVTLTPLPMSRLA